MSFSPRKRRGVSKFVLLVSLAIAGVSGLALVLVGILLSQSAGPDGQLDIALRQIQAGDAVVAEGIAERWPLESLEDDTQKSKQLLTRGAAAWKMSQTVLSAMQAYQLAQKAVELLSESKKIGFPAGYEGIGNFYLGMANLFLKNFEESFEPLILATQRYPEFRGAAFAALITASLGRDEPDIPGAELFLDDWRAIPPVTTAEPMLRVISEAEILAAKSRLDQAIAVLESANGSEHFSYPARMRLIQYLTERGIDSQKRFRANLARLNQLDSAPTESISDKARSDFEKALEMCRDEVADGQNSVPQKRRAQYWMARLLTELGSRQHALSLFASIRIGAPTSPEALLSGVEEIKTLTNLGRGFETAEIASQMSRSIPDPTVYDTGDNDIGQLRLELLEIGRQLQRNERHEALIQYAENLPSLCTLGDRKRFEAEGYRDWANQLSDELEKQPAAQRAPFNQEDVTTRKERLKKAQIQVQQLFFKAGMTFEELAQIELRSSEYQELLWQSISAYVKAHSLDNANRLLRPYIRYEDRSKRPRAYVLLGENQLSAGDYDAAIQTLDQCLMTYPRHPISFQARLTAAKAMAEKQMFDQANELLLQNIYDGDLQPDSAVWQRSLLELGKQRFRQADLYRNRAFRTNGGKYTAASLTDLELAHGNYLKAAERLEEIDRRLDDGLPPEDLYLIAKAYRMAAEYPTSRLEFADITLDKERQAEGNLRSNLLQSALASYSLVRSRMNGSPRALDLSESERSLLRNAYFSEADLMFELRQVDQALEAYRNIANRFLNEPESLEAHVQIARCYEAKGDNVRRDLAYQQAREILDRIPAEKDPQFRMYTRFDRQRWGEVLDWYKDRGVPALQ